MSKTKAVIFDLLCALIRILTVSQLATTLFCYISHASTAIPKNTLPYVAIEGSTYLVSSLCIVHAFAMRSRGQIVHALTYLMQEVCAEEGEGHLIRDGCLIRTVQYVSELSKLYTCLAFSLNPRV